MRLALIATLLFAVACKKDAPPQDPEPKDEGPADVPAEPADKAEPDAKPEETRPETPAPAAKDLAAVVAGLEKAKTFAELLVVSELDKELRSQDVHLTILAPTDEAFAKLPKGTLDKWKKNKDQLQKTLKYHFIPGVNNAQKIGNFRNAPTAAGTELEVKTSQDSDMTIQGGRLTEIDIPASNGMVHLIDTVLQPGKKK